LVSAIRLAQDHFNRNLTQNVIILSTNWQPFKSQPTYGLMRGNFMLESFAPH
jgi:hypothetical protein